MLPLTHVPENAGVVPVVRLWCEKGQKTREYSEPSVQWFSLNSRLAGPDNPPAYPHSVRDA